MEHNTEQVYIYQTQRNKMRVFASEAHQSEYGEEILCFVNNVLQPEDKSKEIIEAYTKSTEQMLLGKDVSWSEDEIQSCILQELKKASRKYPDVEFRHGTFQKHYEKMMMQDEDGNAIWDSNVYGCAVVAAVARKGEQVSYTDQYRYGSSVCEIPWEEFLDETARLVRAGLATQKLTSGKYKVILRNTVAAEMLSYAIGMFHGWNQLSKLSPLYHKTGQQIAVKTLNLKEVPFCEKGRCRRSYDDEGTAVQEKFIIKNGVFVTPLQDKESAKENKTTSTGNGFRETPFENVGVSVTNVILYGEENPKIQSGKSQEYLAEQMKDGLIINAIDGAFAGIDADSGDFSLIAKGEIICDGKRAGTFSDVTISGNILQVLRSILSMGTDYANANPQVCSIVSPSLLVEELIIAGV